MIGMTKEFWMPTLSASAPIRAGTIAPPTTAVMMSPDPLLVIGPSPVMPSAKMLGNMMELKKPQSTSVQMATCPLLTMETTSSKAATKPKSSEQLVRLDLGQHPGAEQTANQRAEPVERDEEGCRLGAVHALGLEVVDGDRGQAHFDADIEKDADSAEHGVLVAPDAAARARRRPS